MGMYLSTNYNVSRGEKKEVVASYVQANEYKDGSGNELVLSSESIYVSAFRDAGNQEATTVVAEIYTANNIATNRDNAYSGITGVFSAPVDGTYLVSYISSIESKTGAVTGNINIYVGAGKYAGTNFKMDAAGVEVPVNLTFPVTVTAGQFISVQMNVTAGPGSALLKGTGVADNRYSITRIA